MKNLYTLAFAALAAMSASAAPGEWTTVENFENNPTNYTAWKAAGTAAGTLSLEILEKDGNADNHAVKFTKGDGSSGVEVEITLPEGKTAADYREVAFDVYNYDMQYKIITTYINGTQIGLERNADGKKGEWKEFSYAMNSESTDNTIKLQVTWDIRNNSFAIDDIRLLEKGEAENPEPGPTEPGDYAATANGTTTDSWFMAEDYQTHTPGDAAAIGGLYGSTAGEATVAVDPTDATNLAAAFKDGDYNTFLKVEVTLPEGKTLKDYKTVAFDIYRYSDDSNYKKMVVKAGDEKLYEDDSYVQQAPAEQWTTKSYSISAATAVGRTFTLLFGISSDGANYMVDKLRFEERGDVKPVEPGNYAETANGTTAGGWFMAEDYQTSTPDDAAAIGGLYGSTSGEATITVDPTDETNLAAAFKGGDYNTLFKVNVTLPEGKTLKDYKTVAFDIYRYSDDSNYKKMVVKAGSEKLFEDESYIEQAKAQTWTTKSYAIDAATEVGGSFTLLFGIASNEAHYMVDKLRFEERESAPAEETEVTGLSYKLTGKKKAIVLDYTIHIKNHTEGRSYSLVINVDGNDEIVETEGEPVAIDAPMRAISSVEGNTEGSTHNLSGTHTINFDDEAPTQHTLKIGVRMDGEETPVYTTDEITHSTTTGIENVMVDAECEAEYFTLDGLRVATPESGRIYIVRRGAKVEKIRF